MKLRSRLLVVLLALLVFVSAQLCYAWLVGASNSVSNTFTVGQIRIELSENSGTFYKIVPGVSLKKDPRVTVKAESEACWLFVSMDTSSGFGKYMDYSPAEGWQALDGQIGVYYRTVEQAASDQSFPLLLQDQVTVKDSVTEEMLNAISANPTMTFYAYAIQQAEIATAETAWQQIQIAQE